MVKGVYDELGSADCVRSIGAGGVTGERLERFGFGDGGRELGPPPQHGRVCLRETASAAAASVICGAGVSAEVAGGLSWQQYIAACASTARPLSVFANEDAPRSCTHVHIEASVPPHRHRFSVLSARSSRSVSRSLRPLGSAGAMGLNLRAICAVRLWSQAKKPGECID